MRWVVAALLLLSMPGPARASQQARPPDVLVIVCNPAGKTQYGNYVLGFVAPMLRAFGCRLTTVTAYADGIPGKSARNYGIKGFMDDEWGRSRDFDGVVVLGHDGGFDGDGIFVDSLTTCALGAGSCGYMQIPMLWVGAANGFDKSGGFADSSGAKATTFNVTRASTAASFTGTQYQIGVPSAVNGEQVAIVEAGYPGVTKLLESVTGGDSTLAWRRNFGNGTGSLTCVPYRTSGVNSGTLGDMQTVITGVVSFISQMPDSVRPRPVFRMALHIDDGLKRDDNTAFGGIQPDQYGTMAQYADSLILRQIPYVLGMECSTDTMTTTDANGLTRWANEMAAWDSPYARYTPHIHAGVNTQQRGANQDLTGHFNDIFGGSRNRACSPTAALDTTLYWNSKVALDTLTARVGSQKVDHVMMPPTDDYSPLNLNSATCNLANMLASYRRAGFTGIRANISPANLASAAADPSGYFSSAALFPTPYGNLAIYPIVGYWPGLDASSQTAETEALRASNLSGLLNAYFVGQLSINGGSQALAGTEQIVVNHIRNYGGAAPGWMVVRDVDNCFRAWNQIAGYTEFTWAWPEQLKPFPWTSVP